VRRALTLASFAGLLASSAAAQDTARQAPVARDANEATRATDEPASEAEPKDLRTDFTAYTRPRGRAAVGPLKIELGIIDEVTLGTYVPPWFAFTVLGTPAPNLYLKARSWWSGPLTLAVRGGFLYLDGSGIAELADANASGSATVLTSEVDASLRLNTRVRVSLGFDYSHLVAVGGSTDVATSIEGASVADTGTARLFAQWQLTRVFGLTFLTRYVVFQSPFGADVSSETPGVAISGDLSAARSSSGTRYAVVPGVSFDWARWEFYLGVGYGTFQIPAVGLPTTRALPIVDLALAFRFDLY
jgi:hypothetical protein